MTKSLRTLFVEDTPDDSELLTLELRRAGFEPIGVRVETAEQLLANLNSSLDVVFSDYHMPNWTGLDALRLAQEHAPEVPFILVSGTIGEEQAVAAMRAGATDFLIKDQLLRLGAAVTQAIERRRLRDEVSRSERVEQRFAAIVQAMQDAVFGMTLDGIVTHWNSGAERLYGWTRDEAIGKSIAILVPEDRPDELRDILDQVQRGQGSDYFETVRVRKDGSRVDVSTIRSPFSDAAGNVLGVSSINRDITERKRAEDEVRKSAERYRALVVATATVVWDSPPSGEFDSEQPAWSAFTGQTLAEHSGWGWLNVIHPDDREKSAQAWAAALKQRVTYQVEHRLRRADGEYRQMSARAVPIFGSDGAIREWVGVHTDITERRQLEDQFRDSQLRLQHVVASSPAVLFTLDFADGRIQGMKWVSDNLQEVFGHSVEAALAPKWWQANVHPDERDAIIAKTYAELLNEGRSRAEYRFRRGDGAYRWTEHSQKLIRDETGKPVEVVGAWWDIAEQKKLEDQFHQAQKMEAFGQLAGGVAHDFNNLLTIINGYSDIVLRRLAPDDKTREFVLEIIKAGDRSATLTTQLLAFSRKQVVVYKILDLNAVVRDVEKMLQRIIGEDIDLDTSLDEDIGSVRADVGQLEQVLLNLAVNARDAMPEGGKLTLETRNVQVEDDYAKFHVNAKLGSYVLLAVSDSGCGMTDDVKARIFEPFFTTKDVGAGTGLGLATVYGIVKQSEGHIEVYSEIDVGTTFKIYLPRVNRASNHDGKSARSDPVPHGTESILLVEDEAGLRGLLHQVLVECGYSVRAAANGIEALRLAREHQGRFHIVVTDVVMPGMGGRQMVEQLVTLDSRVKVLYLSGYTDDAIVRHGILHDQVPFLQKPFSPATLARKVREVLDS